MISIIDVGVGNIGSLQGALYNQGWDTKIVDNPKQIENSTHLIIPGVGSFAKAMQLLHSAGLIKSILQHNDKKKPIMGICLGMQLLAKKGLEGGETKGLGLIDGEVIPLERKTKFRLPHVGWNIMYTQQKHPLLKNIKVGVDFYFVHSYYLKTNNVQQILGKTKYILEYPSIVAKENIVGVQFHPEKSQKNGLQLLDNFCLWNGKC